MKLIVNFCSKGLLLFVALLLCNFSFAQRTITGTVTDGENGEPLIGVNILVIGTGQGSITDFDGTYTLELPEGSTQIEFTYTGYKAELIDVGASDVIDVKLNAGQVLDEVVVIGYGTQKKSVVTGSIASVSEEEIKKTPVLRVEQALQGRTPGVQVTNTSGQPGASVTVRIRGAGTTGGADPLYVVDGLVVGGIDYLNPGDIESIEVLKDAASAAIYGARAANGVVLITTKSGKEGKVQLAYDGYVGFQNPWRNIAMANAREYGILLNEANAAAGLSPVFDNPDALGEGTFWQDEVFNEDAPIMNHQLSVTGGNQKSTFAATLSYFTQEGIVGGDKSQFDRYTARVNSSHEVGESGRLKFGQNFSYSRIETRSVGANSEFGGILSNALNIDPITPVFETDPARLASYDPRAVADADGNVYAISDFATQEIVNPLARLEVTNQLYVLDKFVGNAFGELEIIKGLKVRTQFGIDLAYGVNRSFRPEFFLNAAQISNESRIDNSLDRWFNWNWENIISYARDFGDHNISALVGTTAQEDTYRGFAAGKSGLVFTDFDNAYLNAATNEESATAFGGATESALLSYFGRLTYDFRDKYLFTAVIRRDGSSRFGANTRFGTFPSVSAGWVLTEESFMDNLSFVDFLKLRVSWGQNGNNNIGDFGWAPTIGTGFGYTFGDGTVFTSGAIPTVVPNPDLEWETSEQTDIGIDLRFLDGRLTVTTDYYVKETQGLLVSAPIPGIVGNNPPVVNGGNVENRGWEFALGYQNKAGGDFNYDVNFNFSYNENEVTFINNAEGVIAGAGFSTYGIVSRAAVGFPIGYFWGLQTNGIFQNEGEVESYTNNGVLIQPDAAPGDLRFVDLNNDGTINDQDRTIIGDPTPAWTYGFTLNADYKGIDLSLFIQGATGNDIFNGTRRHDLTTSNFPARFLDRWTGEGSTNEIPRIIASDPNGNFSRISDFYIEDGSFLRVKDLQIGYSLPRTLLSNIGVEKVRFYIAANNLLTFTSYNGFDPEIGAFGLDIGIDRGVYPQARSYRFGLNVIF